MKAAAADQPQEQADVEIPADEKQAKLPVPRFVSLRSASVNLRTGPGDRYPIEWVIARKALPVEIVAEHDIWRRIRLEDGTEGWAHQTMLSGRRTIIVRAEKKHGFVVLKASPDDNARAVAQVENNAMGAVDKCDDSWCRVNFGRYGGWMPKAILWGVYKDERFN